MGETKSQVNARRAGIVTCLLLSLTVLCAPVAQAQTRLIVRDSMVEQFMPNAINQCNQLKSLTLSKFI